MGITKNIIIYDTETTGLDPEDGAEVIQICAKAINYATLTDHHSGTFSCLIKPQRPEKAQPGAIKVIGPLWEKCQAEGLAPKVVWQKFVDWVVSVDESRGKNWSKKPVLIAHNMPFDSKFTRYHMNEYNINKKETKISTPWSYELDSLSFMYMMFESDPNVDNLKLDTLLQRIGMARANANEHDAIEDVDLLAKSVMRTLKFMREANRRMKVVS